MVAKAPNYGFSMKRHRDRAARFYIKPHCIAGYVRDWIDTGEDERNEVDQDIKDLAEQFWDVERQALAGCKSVAVEQ